MGEVVVESSLRRVFQRQYQEGYGWEAAALCDSSQLISVVLVPGIRDNFCGALDFNGGGGEWLTGIFS